MFGSEPKFDGEGLLHTLAGLLIPLIRCLQFMSYRFSAISVRHSLIWPPGQVLWYPNRPHE